MYKQNSPSRSLILLAVLAITGFTIHSAVNAVVKVNPGLAIEKSVDRPVVESDSTDNLVTFTIKVTNKCTPVPADVMLVFDRSDSMKMDGTNPPEPLTTAKASAINFVNALKYDKDRIGLVSYAENPKLESNLTTNPQTVVGKIQGLDTDPFTNISGGLATAANNLRANARPDVVKLIVIFSDGRANRPQPEKVAKENAIAEAVKAKNAGIRIVSIALGDEADRDLMKTIASNAGDYHYAPTAASLNAIFAQISKELQGTSVDTHIKDDFTSLLDSLEIVDANGAKVSGGSLDWAIGDLACGASADVKFTARPKKNISGKVTEFNKAEVSNDNGQEVTSNTVKVDILGPDLSISVTDNKTIAQACEESTYVITVVNSGPGWARQVEIINTIPAYLEPITNSASDGGTYIGNNKFRWVKDIAPGATLTLTVKAKVSCNVPEGYTTVVDQASLNNDGKTKEATDSTQIFKESAPLPNYTLSVCVEVNDGKLKAHFGYDNALVIQQPLDTSVVSVPNVGNVPQLLLPGKHTDVFSAETDANGTIIWETKAKNFQKTIVAASDTTLCAIGSDEDVEPPIVTTPGDEFVGGTITLVPSSGDTDKPAVQITGLISPANCSESQVLRIQFTASDKQGVISAMQYSLDNGTTWYTVKNLTGVGTKSVSGVVITNQLNDGSYPVLVRALDNSGNIGVSSAKVGTINCTGIVIGSTQFNQFTQLSPLSAAGVVRGIEKSPIHFSAAIAGGPAVAEVRTKMGDNPQQIFTLTYDSVLELWITDLQFDRPGLYELEVYAAEANGAATKRSTNSVEVKSRGIVRNQDGEQLDNSSMQLYFRARQGDAWNLWNARAFAQTNPVQSAEVNFFVEPGWYYLQVSHDGYYTHTSKEFYVGEYSFLTSDITLYGQHNLNNWLASITQSQNVQQIPVSLTVDLTSLINNQLPEIVLSTKDKTLTTKDIIKLGKPVIIATWTDWSTIPSAQMQQLDAVAKEAQKDDADFVFLPVALLEGREENDTIVERGNYDLEVYKPSDLSFYDRMFIISAPQYYFIDAEGKVRDITVGNFFGTSLITHLHEVTTLAPGIK